MKIADMLKAAKVGLLKAGTVALAFLRDHAWPFLKPIGQEALCSIVDEEIARVDAKISADPEPNIMKTLDKVERLTVALKARVLNSSLVPAWLKDKLVALLESFCEKVRAYNWAGAAAKGVPGVRAALYSLGEVLKAEIRKL